MTRDPLVVLMQLGAVTVIAVGAVLLLIGARGAVVRGVVKGYPPSLFPRQDIAHRSWDV